MINLTNDKTKILYERYIATASIPFENYFFRRLKPIINRQYMDSAKVVQNNSNDIDFCINKQRTRMIQLLFYSYQRTGLFFAKMALQEIDKVLSKKEPIDDFWRALNYWSSLYTAKRISQINDTTSERIRTIIQMGMQGGLSSEVIATKIRSIGKIASISRAATIARTEIHSATNFAVDTTIQNTRIPFTKEWVSFLDSRVRKTHAFANGQIRSQGESFLVGNEYLDFPGDPKGSAENIVNCRCVLVYNLK